MLQILFLLVIGIIALFVLNALYKRTNAFQNKFVDITKFQNLRDTDRFDVVTLGSNQPKFAFDYSGTGVKGMNWAIGPQTFQYDFALLKKYSKHLNADAHVIIPICPLNFFLLDTQHNNLIKYYQILDASEMPNYNAEQKLKEYSLPLFFHPRSVVRILRDAKPDTRLALASNPMNDEQISKDAAYWIEGCWNPEFNINIANMQPLSEKNKHSIEGNIRILSDMIQYCIDNGFKPVMAYLPVTKNLREKFSASFIENHIMAYTNKAINNRDVKVLNYLDEVSLQNKDYFINSFFMNARGRKLFTAKVMKDLNIVRCEAFHGQQL